MVVDQVGKKLKEAQHYANGKSTSKKMVLFWTLALAYFPYAFLDTCQHEKGTNKCTNASIVHNEYNILIWIHNLIWIHDPVAWINSLRGRLFVVQGQGN